MTERGNTNGGSRGTWTDRTLRRGARRWAGFSLGMRQRLGPAAAVLEPEVLILDEATNGLDPDGIRWIRSLLRDVGAQGRTVLVIQSRVGRVRASVDRVVVFDHGRLVTQSSRAALLASASQVVRIRSPPHRRAARRPHRDGARSRVVAVDRLEVTGCPPERVAVLGAERSISIVEVPPRRPCSKTYSSGSPDVRPDAVLTIMLQLAERR
jgi:ABC-2 type transport system ATP-binding protein